MTTIAQAQWIQRSKRLMQILVAVLVIYGIYILSGPKVGALKHALTPPDLPQVDLSKKLVTTDQNWKVPQTLEYHHKSQGTLTVPIPLEWFLALEQAKPSPLTLFWGEEELFSSPQHMANIGFIPGRDSPFNPHKLPIGFATTDYVSIPGVEGKQTGIGFNCSACHTGQFTYGDEHFVIEGGPATVNLGALTQAIGAALGQTALSSKIPVFNGRFKRFAKRVLKDSYSDATELALADALVSVLGVLAAQQSDEKVIEGSGRLDALNRIGNQVFAAAINRPENYVPIDAPVNFPHIWTTSWFDWVQYDGSIMQPLIRNAGEAMGVRATVNTTAPDKEHRFTSTIPMNNLRWIEDQLSGPEPTPETGITGLWGPKWPKQLPAIDQDAAAKGKLLYESRCQSCHLPTLGSGELWKQPYFDHIVWNNGKEMEKSPGKVLKLKLIPIEQVGTDPAQSNILMTRTVNTSNTMAEDSLMDNSMGIDATVCAPAPVLKKPKSRTFEPAFYQAWDKPAPLVIKDDILQLGSTSPTGEQQTQPIGLVPVPVTDGPLVSFALALGAAVQQVDDAWFKLNYVNEVDQQYFTEGRPNCLRASHAYKARPLDGVWSTAPFLHNGSVPTLMDLLTPANERPEFVQLGGLEFDPVKVGVKQDSTMQIPDEIKDRTARPFVDGIFILDTKIPGNLNTGHEFSDAWDSTKPYSQQQKGVIGPKLSPEERTQIIEYLKTI